MDDRFDFQLVSAEFLDGEGLSYISGSYRAFGNTNTHALNGDITTGSAAAMQSRLPSYTITQAAAVLEALASTTDHLPVVADYQLPARMGVHVGNIPARVVRDASASVQLTVSNTAAVVAAIGADELDYSVTVSGSLIGSVTGSDAALGDGNVHSVSLETATVGTRSGMLEVHSDSQAAASKDFSQPVAFSVLDHAKPLFADNPEALRLTLDFGSIERGSTSEPRSFAIGNWTSELGSTAALDLDQIVATGESTAFTLSLGTFSNLASGSALSFTASFTPMQLGSFNARYDLLFSDENLPGATSLRTLQLDLVGTAIPEPVSSVLLILGLMWVSTIRRPSRGT